MHASARSPSLAARLAIALIVVASLAACASLSTHGPLPRNIIILYADGAAATQFEFARYTSRALRNTPYAVTDTVLRQGTIGLFTTHPHEAFATDSAAAASAMSTGIKATLGAISVAPDGKPLRTAAEVAKAQGKRIGLVTTAEIWDASPAAFSAHAKSRREAASIVDQYFALEPDVLLGGGADFFLPATARGGKRTDGRDVAAAFRAKGYAVARTAAELSAARAPRLLGLFADGAMDFEIDRGADGEPSFADMTRAALRTLAANSPQGFFLFT